MKTKSKLNPNARKWVRALRSGKYKQTKGGLAKHFGTEIRYCCLGVACELFKKSGGKIGREDAGKVVLFGGVQDFLPSPVRKWLGLVYNDGSFGYNDDSLARRNDAGKRFTTIAKIIESQPGGLFAK